jgi:nitrogenase molybdenum-iron protein NifN
VGAQRILSLGYLGAMNMLDRITNTILEAQEEKLAAKLSRPDRYASPDWLEFHPAEA